MIFWDKTAIGREKNFTPLDLCQYTEKLIKEALQRDERVERSNYRWLKSRQLNDSTAEQHLETLKPMIYKMTSESCAAIAVKLDKLTEERIYPIAELLTLMKRLLEDQDSMRAIDKSVRGAKYRRVNKVHPELNGRLATVSFVVESELILFDVDNNF